MKKWVMRDKTTKMFLVIVDSFSSFQIIWKDTPYDCENMNTVVKWWLKQNNTSFTNPQRNMKPLSHLAASSNKRSHPELQNLEMVEVDIIKSFTVAENP